MRDPRPEPVIQLARSEYDVYTCEELAAELEALGGECSTVDFKNVDYIDSSSLTELVRAARRLKAEDPNATLTIVNVAPQVRRIFDITQLSRYFEVS